jgi:pilus assembly protein FimV
MKPKLLTRLLAGAFLVASTAVGAAGLGKMTVLSAIGQPLRAEIDLVSLQKDELGTLSARVALPDAYQQAGIEYNPALPSVKLAIDKRPGGQPYIVVTSTQPINEPYLDLLVELNSAAGKLSREYAVLMDPVGTPSSAPVALPVGKQTPGEPAKAAESVTPNERVARVPAAGGTAGDSYGPVKSGETLSGIARASKPSDVSLDQMLVALFKSNPEAFSGKNMNRLKAGKILRIPDAGELAAIDTAEAAKEVRLQAANWNAYRQQLAASAPAAPDESPKQAASGRISATVEDQVARPAEDVLRLSKADSGGAIKTAAGGGTGTKAMQDRLKALEEELTARDKALLEANDRVQMLEKSVSDMQRLLEIKSADGAKVQTQAVAANQSAQAGTLAEPSKQVETEAPAAAKPAEPTGVNAVRAEDVKAEQQAALPTPKPRVVAPPPVSEPSLVDSITGEPLYLAAGAGGLVLLGALVLMKRRRGRGQAEPELNPEHYAAPEGGLETGATPAVASAAVATTDEMGTVDEATKYLALGRDAQAEEVLKEGLRLQPGQPALLLKLLEVFAGRKDKRAFQLTAQELFAATGGSGEMWLQAARMGRALDPDNAVYAVALSTGVTTGTDVDFDLDVVAPKGVTETDITVDATRAAHPIESTQVMDNDELRRVVQQSGIHNGAVTSNLGVHGMPGNPLSTTDFNLDGDARPDTAGNVALDDISRTGVGSLDINFDLPPEALTTASAIGTGSEIHVDLQKPVSTPTSSDILDFDLSGISLDLDGAATGMQTSPVAPTKNDHWFDVQTKFDLAKAYQEMGDKDSAREILKEVIDEGDAQQQAEAKSLLEALA